jgi:hypothetical protein
MSKIFFLFSPNIILVTCTHLRHLFTGTFHPETFRTGLVFLRFSSGEVTVTVVLSEGASVK